MKLFGFKSKGKKDKLGQAGGTDSDRAALISALENGYYIDAAKAAKRLVDCGDYSCMDMMINGMKDDRMAVPLSRIPDEAVILPLILAISKYAILNLSVSTGSERFSAFSASGIFRNLLSNFPEKAAAYIAEIADYHFFFMKDGELLYTQGKKSRDSHLDRPDLIASSAKNALAEIPDEVIRTAREHEKQNYRKAGSRISESEIQQLLYNS